MFKLMSAQPFNNSMMYLERILSSSEWFIGMGGQW